ncbi:MAG: hypothetical protein GKR88_09170 [Flavobacteriaceae bacterium]|nr:MAG: hypothetical protein GKR88_09170 [Flavobacteriaceae bacterium]
MVDETGRLESSDNPTILTDEIAVIDRGDYKTYTFKLITETETELLYNLVLYADTNGQVYDVYSGICSFSGIPVGSFAVL